MTERARGSIAEESLAAGGSPPFTGLYAILDVDAWRAKGVEVAAEGVLEAIADALLAATPSALQLRAKHEGARDTLALLRRIAPRARAAQVPLVANDRLDLALLAGADLVHVGQDDLPLADVRAIAPALGVGVSTHTLDQLDRALAGAPTYVAFGPVFATSSKERPDPIVGPALLARAAERARDAGVPLVAIGGVGPSNARVVVEAGARWGASIGALVGEGADPASLAIVTARARALHRALGGFSPPEPSS